MQEGPLESQRSLKVEKGGQGVAMTEGLQPPVLALKMERGSVSQKKRGPQEVRWETQEMDGFSFRSIKKTLEY